MSNPAINWSLSEAELYHYNDFENLSIREKHKLIKQIEDKEMRLADARSDIQNSIDNSEPERLECERCGHTNTYVDYDWLDKEVVFCLDCNEYGHVKRKFQQREESQDEIDTYENSRMDMQR